MTAREVLDGIKGRLAAATPGPWKANTDGTIDGTNYAEVICRGQVDCMAYCYGGTSVIEGDNLAADAEFIAAAPSTVARLTAALEAALDACDIVIDNRDGHKPPGPPHPTRQQATAVRIRAAIENALKPKEGQ